MDTLDTLPESAEDDRLDLSQETSGIKREPTEAETEARKRGVMRWQARVQSAKKHWGDEFDRMIRLQQFTRGKQWPGDDGGSEDNTKQKTEDRNYVANIVLRHIQQRVAALYAKNPKAVARRRKMLLNTVWDGSQEALKIAAQQQQAANQILPMAAEALAMGDIGTVTQLVQTGVANMQKMQEAETILADADNVRKTNNMLDRVGETLEVLYEYSIGEQTLPFKSMIKKTVRRAATNGVGYVKVGFQREMEVDPDKESAIHDFARQLAVMHRRAADLDDKEIDENHPEIDDLQNQIAALQKGLERVVREGLSLDYPLSTSIIPAVGTTDLKGFIGADFVAEQFLLTPNKVKEIYKVDVGTAFTGYKEGKNTLADEVQAEMAAREAGHHLADDGAESTSEDLVCVWMIYSKDDGLVYHVADGYPDYLREPAEPEVYIERFWPWFALTFNDCEGSIFPPSDVELIQDMQLEINRSRQSLREHRRANRPKMAVAAGLLSDEDKTKLESHPANAVLELDGLQPGQNVDDVLQAVKGSPIDPNLYETNSHYEDTMRVTGTQEANLGGTSGATATETQVAETSRMTSLGSNIDDLDDLLTAIAKASGQILLLEVSEQTVKEIVGPGAVWPQMNRQQVSQDLYLEVEAGSTGRPSKATEVQNAERLMPLLMQIPGIDPEWMGREIIQRMDDKIDLTDAFAQGVPSIMAINAMQNTQGAAGMAQGGQGGANSEKPPETGGAKGPDEAQTRPV